MPFERVAALVSQITHDVRNGLNGMELQSAYVGELLRDPEDTADAVAALKQLRKLIEERGQWLRWVSSRFHVGVPDPVRYPVKFFIEDFQLRLAKKLPAFAPQVAWTQVLAEEAVAVDIEMAFTALGEILQNAAHFQERAEPVAVHAKVQDGFFHIELREHHAALDGPPAEWGREPFVSTRPGGHGLGVFPS